MKHVKLVTFSAVLFLAVGSGLAVAQREGRDNSRNQQQTKATSRKTPNNDQKPKWGTTVSSAPRKTTVIKTPQNNYKYRDGVYYRPTDDGRYHAGPAPVGARIRTLPTGFVRLVLGSVPYFYYYGTFYRTADQSYYEVVAPPVGATVYDLPEGYEKVIIEGISYYTYDGIYFKAFVDDRGEVAYEVVGDMRS